MSENINVTFCRSMLALVMADVKPLTTPAERKDAWVYRCMRNHWEFHGPDSFYWHGSADNAYDARQKGWSRWFEIVGPQRVLDRAKQRPR